MSDSGSAYRYDLLAQSAGGLGSSHRWMLDRIPEGAAVLDCGCAGGFLARAAVAERGARVDGLEIDPDAAERAAAVCGTVRVGSLDDPAFLDRLSGSYDRILFGDVLEHLATPEVALRAIAGLLAPGGRILISIPNVAYWRLRLDLLRGRFDYTDHGLMDRTHLRFYTYRTVEELVAAAGCRIAYRDMTLRVTIPGLAGGIVRHLIRLRPNLFAYQTLLEVVPCLV